MSGAVHFIGSPLIDTPATASALAFEHNSEIQIAKLHSMAADSDASTLFQMHEMVQTETAQRRRKTSSAVDKVRKALHKTENFDFESVSAKNIKQVIKFDTASEIENINTFVFHPAIPLCMSAGVRAEQSAGKSKVSQIVNFFGSDGTVLRSLQSRRGLPLTGTSQTDTDRSLSVNHFATRHVRSIPAPIKTDAQEQIAALFDSPENITDLTVLDPYHDAVLMTLTGGGRVSLYSDPLLTGDANRNIGTELLDTFETREPNLPSRFLNAIKIDSFQRSSVTNQYLRPDTFRSAYESRITSLICVHTSTRFVTFSGGVQFNDGVTLPVLSTWDLEGMKPVRDWSDHRTACSDAVTSMTSHKSNPMIFFTGWKSGRVLLFDMRSSSHDAVAALPQKASQVLSVTSMWVKRNTFASACDNGEIFMWDDRKLPASSSCCRDFAVDSCVLPTSHPKPNVFFGPLDVHSATPRLAVVCGATPDKGAPLFYFRARKDMFLPTPVKNIQPPLRTGLTRWHPSKLLCAVAHSSPLNERVSQLCVFKL